MGPTLWQTLSVQHSHHRDENTKTDLEKARWSRAETAGCADSCSPEKWHKRRGSLVANEAGKKGRRI